MANQKVYIKNKNHPWYNEVCELLAEKPYPITGKPGLLLELKHGAKCFASPDDVTFTSEQ